MLPDNAGDLKLPLELVRLSPSAVNKQPCRAVVDNDCVHFYEKQSKGYVVNGWDTQKIDMGIAMCHFVCGIDELQMKPDHIINDPGIACPKDTGYIATLRIR